MVSVRQSTVNGLVESNGSCSCPYHCILKNESQLRLSGNGSFIILPSCPRENNSDIEHVLAVLWSDRVHHIFVKSDHTDQLFIDGYPRRKFGTVHDLIRYLEEGRRLLLLSNGEAAQPQRHCAGSSAPPPHQAWYHPTLGGAEARALVAKQPQGAFLAYPRPNFDAPLALCVHGEDAAVACFRVHVRSVAGNSQRCFISDEFSFPSVGELVNFYRSRSLADGQQRRYRLDVPVQTTAFVARVVSQRVQDLLACDGLRTEFKDICQATSADSQPKTAGQLPANAAKNRYQNVLPFDATRVVLRGGSGSGDYINASRIDPPDGQTGPGYIATQGPLEGTRADLWRMVWQEGSRVIVMVTKEVEGRKRKCQRYWPTKSEGTLEFSGSGPGTNKLTVRHVKETEDKKFSVIKLMLSGGGGGSSGGGGGGGGGRLVHLLRYQHWPDHGTPLDPASVLHLLAVANRLNGGGDEAGASAGGKSPPPALVIHCSAGIGRTGCLMAIDNLVRRVETVGLEAAVVDVADAVLRMRRQRAGIVQNLAQYRFVYSALVVHIDSRLRPLMVTPTGAK